MDFHTIYLIFRSEDLHQKLKNTILQVSGQQKNQRILNKKLPSEFWFGEQMKGECMSCERMVWVKVEFDKSSKWPNWSGELIT